MYRTAEYKSAEYGFRAWLFAAGAAFVGAIAVALFDLGWVLSVMLLIAFGTAIERAVHFARITNGSIPIVQVVEYCNSCGTEQCYEAHPATSATAQSYLNQQQKARSIEQRRWPVIELEPQEVIDYNKLLYFTRRVVREALLSTSSWTKLKWSVSDYNDCMGELEQVGIVYNAGQGSRRKLLVTDLNTALEKLNALNEFDIERSVEAAQKMTAGGQTVTQAVEVEEVVEV